MIPGTMKPLKWEPCPSVYIGKKVCPVHGVYLRGNVCPVQDRYREARETGLSMAVARMHAMHEWGYQTAVTERRKGANDA
jgi:hypothetical protein